MDGPRLIDNLIKFFSSFFSMSLRQVKIPAAITTKITLTITRKIFIGLTRAGFYILCFLRDRGEKSKTHNVER
jgi:hypothetical protein